MTYKDTLFFIGKCLTVNHAPNNYAIIEHTLKKTTINWDDIVKISTAHYVFPALYCNLKRADFLKYLPKDLVEYMTHITDLNRDRNQQIIDQAKEINSYLLKHSITPIFLKGTGNLLAGLYNDIGERMVGDIDFLVARENCNQTFELLNNYGYNNKISELFDEHRHLPRITNENKIAAIEIHREMIKTRTEDFNYNTILSSIVKKDNISLLSIENKIKLTVYSKFINDDAYLLKKLSLRPAYDLFLLGHQLNNSFTIKEDKLSKELKAGLKIYTSLLSRPKLLPEVSDDASVKYHNSFIDSIGKEATSLKRYLWLKERLEILIKSLFKKSYFKFVISKFIDANWWKTKLGIKSKF